MPANSFFDPKKWKKLPFEARARVRIAATVAPSKPSRSNTASPAASRSSRAVAAINLTLGSLIEQYSRALLQKRSSATPLGIGSRQSAKKPTGRSAARAARAVQPAAVAAPRPLPPAAARRAQGR